MELRKDYILNRWVIISEARGKRPFQFVEDKTDLNVKCPFCVGNESMTPNETYKLEKDGKWQIRAVPNKFSAVDPNGGTLISTHNTYYTFAGDHGEHEVVIETPDHGKHFGDLTCEEMIAVMNAYKLRINEFEKESNTKYVCVFKNQGKEAGASVNHAHSQIIALAMTPPILNEKIETIKKYPHCPYCEIISKEKDSYRRCFENDSFVAFTPYASRFNYEIWVMPKKHLKTFNEFDYKTYYDLSLILKEISLKLESKGISYNIEWYYSPKGEELHFHIEIMPRIALWAGFEIGYGITINSISPEIAAKFYRGEE